MGQPLDCPTVKSDVQQRDDETSANPGTDFRKIDNADNSAFSDWAAELLIKVSGTLMEIDRHTASGYGGVVALFVLVGTPVLGPLALGEIVWYATARDFGLALIIWFILMIFGSLCIYRPYLRPLTLRVCDQVLAWVREGDVERPKKQLKRQEIPLKNYDLEN